MHLSFNEAKFNKQLTYLVVELLQQAVQPGLSHLHGPSLVGYVADFDENHHQLQKDKQPGVLGPPPRSWFPFKVQLLHVPHHVSVLLVVEVESRQDGFEFVEDLVVPRHVRGQDAPAGQADWSVNSDLPTTRRNRHSGRRTISLDDSLPDPFVLVHSKISEDVALCLESGKSSVYSPLRVYFKFQSF